MILLFLCDAVAKHFLLTAERWLLIFKKALASIPYVHYRRHMDINTTVKMMGALSQETRLTTFRMLVQSGPEGMAAGEIARKLETPHNTMSSHLAILSNAGLLKSHRESRSIIYSIDFEGLRKLLSFLMQDCCQGQAEVCTPVLDSLVAEYCNSNLNSGALT